MPQHPSPLPPVFVLSLPRSGSTLMRYVLDTHQDVCSPAEIHLGNLCDTLYQVVESTLGQTVPEERRGLEVLVEVNRLVSDVMERYAERKGKRVWCDKSPTNVAHAELLRRVFPQARFVCLYRNCMDFIQSALQGNRFKWWWKSIHPYLVRADHDHVQASASYWVDLTGALLDFEERHSAACFRLTYESLVFSPERTLGELFSFLDLDFPPELLDRVFDAEHDDGVGDSKIRFTRKIETGSVGKGIGIPVNLLAPELLERVNEVLERLDYPTIGADFNQTPSLYIPEVARGSGAASPVEASPDRLALARDFETRISRRLEESPERLKKLGASFKIVVEDLQGGVWILDPEREAEALRREDAEADCVVTLTAAILSRIVQDRLNAQEAFLRGDIRVRGDNEAAARLGLLL